MSGVRLSGEWSALVKALDARDFRARLAKALGIAQERVGRDFQARARRAIQGGVYAPNSPITRAIKGSSKPLVDHGDLYQSITFQVADPYTLRLGIMRARSGQKAVNIGLVLHEGATIDVGKHPQVRRAVWAKVRDAIGAERLATLTNASRRTVLRAAGELGVKAGGHRWTPKQRAWWFATHPTFGPRPNPIWVIPARPFIAGPAGDPDFHRAALAHYSEAVKAAFGKV